MRGGDSHVSALAALWRYLDGQLRIVRAQSTWYTLPPKTTITL
jgi:hypothetical protein